MNEGDRFMRQSFGVLQTWVEKTHDSCISHQVFNQRQETKQFVCCWCKNSTVNFHGFACSKCLQLPLNPFMQMTRNGNIILYNNIPFYCGHDATDLGMPPNIALAYAHMRVESQQKEINALKLDMKELKQTMNDFIAACELVPDGPMAQEIVERTHKMLKK